MKIPATSKSDVVLAINQMDLTFVLIEVRKYMAKETGFVFYMNPADTCRMWQFIPSASDYHVRRVEGSLYVAETRDETWQIKGKNFTECLWRLAYLAIVTNGQTEGD